MIDEHQLKPVYQAECYNPAINAECYNPEINAEAWSILYEGQDYNALINEKRPSLDVTDFART